MTTAPPNPRTQSTRLELILLYPPKRMPPRNDEVIELDPDNPEDKPVITYLAREEDWQHMSANERYIFTHGEDPDISRTSTPEETKAISAVQELIKQRDSTPGRYKAPVAYRPAA